MARTSGRETDEAGGAGCSRRRFLQSTSGAAAAVMAGGSPLAAMAQDDASESSGDSAEGASSESDANRAEDGAGAEDGERMRFAVKLGMVAVEAPLIEKFTLLKRLGYDGVELDSPNDLDTAEVCDARDATGLTIHGVVDSAHWHDTLSDPDPAVRARGVKALETAIRDAKDYGASTVLLVPAVVTKDVPYDAAYERSQAEIRRALPLAEELGVAIAFENVWNNFLLSPMEAARYVDELESSHVGWYFDVGNVVNYGWPEQWIRILGPRIRKLDVKEFSRKKRNDEGLWKGFSVEIGEGDCDWPAVREALDDIGYRGWATAEVAGGHRERLADILQRMRMALGPKGEANGGDSSSE